MNDKKEKKYVAFTLNPDIVNDLYELCTNNSYVVEKLIYDYLESEGYDLKDVIL